MALLTTSMIDEIRQVAEEYSAREHQRRLDLSNHVPARPHAQERGRAQPRMVENRNGGPRN